MVELSIVASGTQGDVRPYVALGKGLKDAGYNVRLLTNENFEGLVTEAGLAFCSTGPDIESIIQSDEWRKVTESGNFLKILTKMQTETKQRAADSAQRMPGLLKGSDLILTGMAVTGIYSIASMLQIPVVQAYVFPFTPTQEFPCPLVPKLPFGGVLNNLSFHVTRQMFWQTSKVGDATTRKVLGLGKQPFWGPYQALAGSQAPVLYGYSPHVLPRPNDWADKNVVTGYWFLDPPDDWDPPSGLVDFLNAGKRPVYIGFGSMGSRKPEEAAQIALEALKLSGQRGVLASGWGGLNPSSLPDSVYLTSSIQHSWLFPQMAAVAHHGGAGTTAAGLRAGVPSITIPFMGDQPFWGHRIDALGVGPTPIPRKQLTAERLAKAITEAVSDVTMRRKADELGCAIRAEDGIGNAVALVDRFIQRSGKNAVQGVTISA